MKPHHIEEIISMYKIDNKSVYEISDITGIEKSRCRDVLDVYDYMECKIHQLNNERAIQLAEKDAQISKLNKELADFYKAVARCFVYGDDINKPMVTCSKPEVELLISPFKDDRE